MLEQGKTAGEYIISEVCHDLSRDKVSVSGGKLVAGTVLGVITSTGVRVPLDVAASDGSQNAAEVLWNNTDATVAVSAVTTSALTAVRESDLVWPSGITDAQKTAAIEALASKHIKVKGA